MTNFAEETYSKTDKEYAKEDKLRNEYRKLFEILKGMEEIGEYATAKWNETFSKYAETFKKVNGYRPHWVR